MATDRDTTAKSAMRQARERLGLTQVQLAADLGVPQSTVSRVETGTERPLLDTALAIAKRLDSTVEALFGCTTP